MKIPSVLTNTLLASALAISQNLFFVSHSNQAKAQESTRPYVVIVNGQGNCCAWGMDALAQRLKSLYGITRNDFRYVPYSNFRDGGQSGGGNTYDWSSVDTQFLRDGADFINNQLDRNRPLILIGHSYGGDSVLKLLPRINRQIQFVAVIDPVGTGGFRRVAQESSVPANVDYFFNRWQENVMFPVDFSSNGSIRCSAKQCDQDSQNIARGEDGTPRTTECRWDEVTCPGFVAPIPFVREGRKGTKQVRVGHQDLPQDPYIQRILGGKIQAQLKEQTSSVPDSGTSTYQNSCNNISISGNSLSANCRSSNGQFIQSSVNLKGIENINGVLSVTSSDRPSNFQLSCNSISIRRNVLSATCKTSNGNLNQTSISLNGIENIDGILKYTSNP